MSASHNQTFLHTNVSSTNNEGGSASGCGGGVETAPTATMNSTSSPNSQLPSLVEVASKQEYELSSKPPLIGGGGDMRSYVPSPVDGTGRKFALPKKDENSIERCSSMDAAELLQSLQPPGKQIMSGACGPNGAFQKQTYRSSLTAPSLPGAPVPPAPQTSSMIYHAPGSSRNPSSISSTPYYHSPNAMGERGVSLSLPQYAYHNKKYLIKTLLSS